MKSLACAVLLCASVVQAAVIKDGVVIPTYAEVCRRSDPEFDSCLRGSVETLIHKIARKGIKGLKLPSLDPMIIEEWLGSFKGAGYNFTSVIRDEIITGIGDIQVSAVRTDMTDPENINIELDFYFPEVKIAGKYKLDGLVASIPVGGRGPFSVNATDLAGTVKINGHLIDIEGEKYMRTHRVEVFPKVRKMRVNFENVIQGNKELTDAANNFFNNFWEGIFDAVLPFTKEGTDKIFRYYLNLGTMKIPFEQLFPY